MTNQEFIESIRLEGEEWRDVRNAEGLYVVSSFGRIFSLERKIKKSNGVLQSFAPHILNGEYNRDGYRMVYVNYGEKRRLVAVHRLVAEAFIPNPQNLSHVDHIDRNRRNNNASNLRWVTCSENLRNREPHPVARILNGKIDRVYPFLFSVEADGFSAQLVSHCCLGRRKTHKGYQWKYLSATPCQYVKELFYSRD